MSPSTSPDQIHRLAADWRLDEMSDAELVHRASRRLAVPRLEHPDSFVLHAPLELLARAALLAWASPAQQRAARLRIVSLVAGVEAGEPAILATPAPSATEQPAASEIAARLTAAIAAKELDDAALLAAQLARVVSPTQLRTLVGEAVIGLLSAAGHASIYFHLAPRVSPRGEVDGALLAPLARELARHSDLSLQWIDGLAPPGRGTSMATADPPAALQRALDDTPLLGLPGTNFIFPLMHQADSTFASELLGPAIEAITVDDARIVLLRHAARCMLFGTAEHRKYGWSHCLTMTQGALTTAAGCADPRRAIAVAATYVAGFVAGEATEPIPRSAPPAAPPWGQIVSHAATFHDAHLVKYVLACLDAAAADPPADGLFRAAANTLLGDWEASADDHDPLAELSVRRAATR